MGGAIILAGGESTRMGFDKALLPFSGKTLLEEVFQKVRPFFEQIYVVVEDAKKINHLELFGAKVCEDLIPKAGPLAGLYTGLCQSIYALNMVFSVDMPFVDEASISKLIHAHHENSSDASCFETPDGNVQPFPGIYSKDSRRWMRLLIEQNEKSMKRLFQVIDCRKIPFDAMESPVFKNLNHSEDYWDALDLLRMCPQ
jgi:molybdopterin-guanine dinucleotide biosynthesis protein A